MQHDWIQLITCSLVKCIPIECSGFHAVWLNAVDSMQPGKMHPVWMPWIPCSMIECSVFHALWRNGSLLNAGDFMQHDWRQWIPAEYLNAVDFMQHGQKHPEWMQWIPCSVKKWNILNAVDIMQHDWMQWIPCSEAQCILIERSAYHAVWLNGSRLNAVDSMQCGAVDSDWMHRDAVYHNWMQWIR